MRNDPYIVYIGAKGVAFAWVGALLGPLLLVIGVRNEFSGHFYAGLIAILIVLVSFRDGLKGMSNDVISDFLAYAVVPAVLLVAGAVLAWLANVNNA